MTELLAKYFSGNATEAEKQKVAEWKNQSDLNAEEFFEYASVWNHEDLCTKDKLAEGQDILDEILTANAKLEESKSRKIVIFPRAVLKYAAILTLVVLGTFGYFQFNSTLTSIQKMTTSGEVKTIELPDGSKVFLHQNSNIEYNQNFTQEKREIYLSGVAFFEVKKDPSKPFVVHTDQSDITVLGTSFYVKSGEHLNETEVIVEEGKVSVNKANADGKSGIFLTPGQAGRVNYFNDEIEKYDNRNPNYLSWKTKVLKFERDDLSYVINTIEDAYQIEISTTENQILQCELSAVYKDQSIDNLMKILGFTFNLEVTKINGGKFNLSGDGCNSPS